MGAPNSPRSELIALSAECERLKAELTANAQDRQARFEHTPLPMWIYEKVTLRFLDVNEAALRSYGYSRAEFQAMTLRDLHPVEELPALNTYLKTKRAGYMKSGTWRHRKKNGTLLTVESFSDDLVHEGSDARIVVIVDVTERMLAEEALRLSEERFHLVSSATSDAIWDLNLLTDALWWGEGYYTLFGYDRTTGISTHGAWAECIHPDDKSRITESFQRAISGTGAEWTEEYRYRRKDGAYASVQDRGRILRDVTGRAVRMVGGMTDITEHKKLLTQYLRAQRMESIGTLAGGVAHDLNNVLSPILMSIELLRINATDESAKRLLVTIEKSARRGADLVRQVLTFARGIEGSHVAIKIDHLIKDVSRIAEETFTRSIQTEIIAPKDLWAVTGDATQLHQVILNLAVNARDAMPAGGTLTLSAENIVIDAQYAATSRDAKAGPYVCVSVADTGCGIPGEILERIFEPFFTTKEVGKGTGLGLATAHAIVKSHGGFITVYSEIGKGSMFKIYAPADPNLQPTDITHTTAELPRGNGETILVIDDEVSILTITGQTLEAFGYRVLVAHDGAEAIAIYAQHRDTIAAVLTDMVMPIMDGPATISALMRINPHVLVIAASGLTTNNRVAQAAGIGVKHFIPKPYTADTLLVTLRNVLHP
ncbi:MAG: PAS domain-containing protein [Verrucomicrobia bacterium]|nr:PAS domain-containing protein [Verrucomicrobiota bacterium]